MKLGKYFFRFGFVCVVAGVLWALIWLLIKLPPLGILSTGLLFGCLGEHMIQHDKAPNHEQNNE